MAASTRILHLRRKALHSSATNRVSFRRFSSSSSSPFPSPDSPDSPDSTTDPSPAAEPSPKSLNAYLLNSIKSSLKESPRNHSPPPPSRNSPSFSPSKPQSLEQVQQIQQNLAGYRNRTVPPPSSTEPSSSSSLDGIRQSLRSLKPSADSFLNRSDGRSHKWSLPNPNSQHSVIGGMKGNALPMSVFGPEINDYNRNRTTPFHSKLYSNEELGKKLSLLRPEKKKGWFSLEELSERMARLREKEKEKEDTEKSGNKAHSMIRDSLLRMQDTDNEKAREEARKRNDFKFNALSLSGRTSLDLSSPPKEDLVEKYFHPDNMSAADKMKIELQKVRDEFKKSESDCGSTGVQVAQLTTKIKHLSEVLHPKDKHSKKGLRAMVEKRKKLLKYLRRTDWDSYCLVVSKLGLRDNPGYKI